MKTLYFDCFSGLSGDMVIGALIDAGADPKMMTETLKKLHIEDEYELKWDKVIKNGITSTKFDVILNNNHANVQGHHEHTHSHSHEHSHDHGHVHHHNHDHHHRTYKSIVKMIKAAHFSESVEIIALDIFKKIGESEGRIHGLPLEDVHFHEVGAVDSIIDIVGAAILIDQLKIDHIICAHVPVGSGHIHIDHGIYPVPAPATLDILRGVPIAKSDIESELTTPTGAAIASVLADDFGTLPTMTVTSIGYGAGTKTFPDHPNVLRIVMGEMI